MASDTLFEQLKHPNPNLRERAMLQIAENQDENTIPRLMNNLSDEDTVYRRASVKALGVVGIEAVAPLVEKLLHDDNPTTRASCAKALTQIAVNFPDTQFPQKGLEGLKTAIEDPNPVVHIASVMALGEIGSPAFEILAETLKNTENLAVAVATINAFGSMGDSRGLEVLAKLAEDESADPYIIESARSALPRLEQVIKYQQMNT
ncbi:MAG: HEAT repeat domain-containing protein [Cyanobacteria bacterium P01_A01_bin.84]